MAPEQFFLLENINESGKKLLEAQNYQVTCSHESLDPKTLTDHLVSQGFEALGIRSKTEVSKETLKSATKLQAIGAFCIGTNQIDLGFASSRGIPVFNAPYSNTRSVAELVLSEIIALSRQIVPMSLNLHQGNWQKTVNGSFEIRGKTLGIIGYGHIGTQVGLLCEALGLRVLYYDIEPKLPLGNMVSCAHINDLLSESDFVTLHVPETPDTKMMMGQKEFSSMKKGSYFINASRGSVVNIEDLAQALKSGHLAGAAVDVFPKEPRKNGPNFESELLGLRNVILTPHIGGSTYEAQVAIGKEVSTSLDKYFRLGETIGAVNFPKLRASKIQDGTLRLCHIHKNTPGVLAQVNTLFSRSKVNILYQKLGTFGDIGYLIMDFQCPNKQQQEELNEAINKEDFTIRARILKGES